MLDRILYFIIIYYRSHLKKKIFEILLKSKIILS